MVLCSHFPQWFCVHTFHPLRRSLLPLSCFSPFKLLYRVVKETLKMPWHNNLTTSKPHVKKPFSKNKDDVV